MWGTDQWEYFDTIIEKESFWTVNTDHPGESSAYGLGGFLNSTWESVGCTKTDDRLEQLRCTALYIKERYETPQKAVKFHNVNNWY